MLKGKKQVQMDPNCSLSPLATQLLEFNQTKMLNYLASSVLLILHYISGGSSTSMKREWKYSPTPIAQVWVKFENAVREWIISTPRDLSLVSLGRYGLSRRTSLLTAQGTIMRSLSPEMINLGLQSSPNLKSSLASSIELQYLFSLRAYEGTVKDMLRNISATYFRSLYQHMMWTVDLYLLIVVHFLDQSSTKSILYQLLAEGRKATNLPSSVRAQYFPWSGMASVKNDCEGGTNS